MRRLSLTAMLAVFGCAVGAVGAQSAFAATLCVGAGAGCYPTLQAAVAAAKDGDTITVGAGTYAGGITIEASVHLVGAGAASTIIQGGGPVVTIGDPAADPEPTVSISRVTITGGVSTTNPFGGDTFATGGGVEISPAANGLAPGATVSISDSVITANRASPLSVADDHVLCFPRQTCALAGGGGIDNSGRLTLTNTQVTDNVAGSTPTDPSVATLASGGGISNGPLGTMTVDDSVVSGNTARATSSDAVDARGGGILDSGTMTVSNSRVTGNGAELSSSLFGSIFDGSAAHAAGGGIAIADGGSATVAASTIAGNDVSSVDTGGDANADAAGIDVEGSLALNNSHVDANRLQASVDPASGFFAIAFGGGLEIGEGSKVSANNSSVDDNAVRAESDAGGAFTLGGGLADDATVTLHHTEVSGNTEDARGSFGAAAGGGIGNSDYDGPAPRLTLVGSDLSGNSLTGTGDIALAGGGLFTADLITSASIDATLKNTEIAGNSPDQCFGC